MLNLTKCTIKQFTFLIKRNHKEILFSSHLRFHALLYREKSNKCVCATSLHHAFIIYFNRSCVCSWLNAIFFLQYNVSGLICSFFYCPSLFLLIWFFWTRTARIFFVVRFITCVCVCTHTHTLSSLISCLTTSSSLVALILPILRPLTTLWSSREMQLEHN